MATTISSPRSAVSKLCSFVASLLWHLTIPVASVRLFSCAAFLKEFDRVMIFMVLQSFLTKMVKIFPYYVSLFFYIPIMLKTMLE